MELETPKTPSPYLEWSDVMFFKAADFTLQISLQALESDLVLPSVHPSQIVFDSQGPQLRSRSLLQARIPSDPTWPAFETFVQNYLLPLWLHKKKILLLRETLSTYPNGITWEQASEYVKGWKRWTPSFLTLIGFPAWLRTVRQPIPHQAYLQLNLPPSYTKFVVRRLLHFLQQQLLRLQPK